MQLVSVHFSHQGRKPQMRNHITSLHPCLHLTAVIAVRIYLITIVVPMAAHTLGMGMGTGMGMDLAMQLPVVPGIWLDIMPLVRN